MPTVPLVEAQSAIVSTTARSVGSTGLTSLNRLDKGLRGGDMLRFVDGGILMGRGRRQGTPTDAASSLDPLDSAERR